MVVREVISLCYTVTVKCLKFQSRFKFYLKLNDEIECDIRKLVLIVIQ